MRSSRTGPVIGLIGQLAQLVVLAGTVGLGAIGWIVGVACGVFTCAALARAVARSGARELGPADRVTLVRATLVGDVAALAADSLVGPAHVPTLVTLAVVALLLDAVDGWVARRTGTVSKLGARFDAEVDSFLILVLSVYVAQTAGWWVLIIGTARYAFGALGWLVPWMRRRLPPRYWRKVVAATLGITLTFAAADILPRAMTDTALVACLALLAESFGRDLWWLWERRRVQPERLAVMVGNGAAERPQDAR